MRTRRFSSYKPPAKDSPRARASAAQFLVGARSLDGVTAQWLAHQYRLTDQTAKYLLDQALQGRAVRLG